MTRTRKAPPGPQARRRLFLCFLLMAPVIPVVAAVLIVDPGPGVTQTPGGLETVDFRLRNLVLGADGVAVGSSGRDHYRIVDNGNRTERWASFPAVIQGVHETASGNDGAARTTRSRLGTDRNRASREVPRAAQRTLAYRR